MATARLATALWIHTHAPFELVRTALEELPLVSEAADNGFVHVLYDVERWTLDSNTSAISPASMVQDRLHRARVKYEPAIGRETLPTQVT